MDFAFVFIVIAVAVAVIVLPTLSILKVLQRNRQSLNPEKEAINQKKAYVLANKCKSYLEGVGSVDLHEQVLTLHDHLANNSDLNDEIKEVLGKVYTFQQKDAAFRRACENDDIDFDHNDIITQGATAKRELNRMVSRVKKTNGGSWEEK